MRQKVASEESFEMLVVAGNVGGESCEEFEGSASSVRKFASFCQDTDGRVIKNDAVKSKRRFCQVSGEKESSLGVLWFDDSLCPCSKPGVFLFEYLGCDC